ARSAALVFNGGSAMTATAQIAIELVVGPDVLTGSTLLKAGTAQKLVLNMISTSVMIGMGRVLDNKMVDMQLSNRKLVDRGTKILKNALDISYEDAHALLMRHGNVRKAMEAAKKEKHSL
ncbi:MAG: N-acetylmuramic acid 6-phosphate etherase, partial [Saprospiraceae bacterium]|nr:N-acetylmuramic acid 6-phosphate etherase [Saprospiraceae bacterium]